MSLKECSFDPKVFKKIREHLLEHEIGKVLFYEVVWEAYLHGLLSGEPFSADRTLLKAAASIKNIRRREQERQPPDDDPANPSADFPGESLRDEMHEDSNVPEARLVRKGKGK